LKCIKSAHYRLNMPPVNGHLQLSRGNAAEMTTFI